jgi:hypothetical protein
MAWAWPYSPSCRIREQSVNSLLPNRGENGVHGRAEVTKNQQDTESTPTLPDQVAKSSASGSRRVTRARHSVTSRIAASDNGIWPTRRRSCQVVGDESETGRDSSLPGGPARRVIGVTTLPGAGVSSRSASPRTSHRSPLTACEAHPAMTRCRPSSLLTSRSALTA